MNMFTKNFKQISKKDVGIAGGKGASLGEMTQAGINVPPGFVVLASAFERFLEETDLFAEIDSRIKKINYKDINSVDRASNEIRDLIGDAKFPEDIGKEILTDFNKLGAKFVAVRSSATAEDSSIASWAGELETYLNTTRKTLLDNVKQCWSSLFTPRALFYRNEKGLLKQKVSVAVVVQKMVQSDISGITFTVHPVIKDRNQMVIEAGYGLGEAIVSGQITPDTCIIRKPSSVLLRVPLSGTKQSRGSLMGSPRSSREAGLARDDFQVIDINISKQERMIVRNGNKGIEWKGVSKNKQEKQKLAEAQIIKLAKLCQKIEKHYNYPQDIEWAIEKGKFYITQSRPITTL